MINRLIIPLILVLFSAIYFFLPFEVPLGANTAVTEIPDQIIIGYIAFNVFENTITGESLTEITTMGEYEAVRLKDAVLPQKNGYVWKQNGLIPQYVTSPLENNTYFKTRQIDTSSTTLVRVKVQNKEGIVPITDIVNNQLTETGLQKLQ